MWAQFGPSATGIGWDSGFLGLSLHLGGATDGPTPEQAMEWMMSDEGKAFSRGSADGWAAAHVEDGADPDAAAAAADATYLMYTGQAGEWDAGSLTRGAGRESIHHRADAGDIVEAPGAAPPRVDSEGPAPMTLFDGITARIVETPRTRGEHPGAGGRRPRDAARAHGRPGPRERRRRRCSGRS